MNFLKFMAFFYSSYLYTYYVYIPDCCEWKCKGGTYMDRWKAVRMFFGCFWWCSILPMSVWVKQKSTLCVGGALNHFQSFPPPVYSTLFHSNVQGFSYAGFNFSNTPSAPMKQEVQLSSDFFSGNHSMPYHIFCIIWMPILRSNS